MFPIVQLLNNPSTEGVFAFWIVRLEFVEAIDSLLPARTPAGQLLLVCCCNAAVMFLTCVLKSPLYSMAIKELTVWLYFALTEWFV